MKNYERVGRSMVYVNQTAKEEALKHIANLSFVDKLRKKYHEFRIKLIDRRVKKHASFSRGYRYELLNAALYEKQAQYHKIDSLYLRAVERAYKDES